jgi:hypothetical protein
VLSPDHGAPLPLWGEGFGNIAWQFTKFPPELLDRLAAWQQEFDDNYHYRTGWRSAATHLGVSCMPVYAGRWRRSLVCTGRRRSLLSFGVAVLACCTGDTASRVTATSRMMLL